MCMLINEEAHGIVDTNVTGLFIKTNDQLDIGAIDQCSVCPPAQGP